MPYTLETLIADCRASLANGDSPAALDAVRAHAATALADADFLAANILNREAPPERTVIYEDPDLGFCICVHVYPTAKPGGPHDHGPTWAIYGQAEGETEMVDWYVVQQATNETPALVKEEKRYVLKPGDVHVYPTGAIHAPVRFAPTRLLRIEGSNTDRIKRTPIEIAA